MNSWQLIENEQLESLGWHLWARPDADYGIVYQSSTRTDLTPKSRAGYIDVSLLLATKQHKQFIH